MENGRDNPGLYLHVPFCRVKCGYCDFKSAEYDPVLTAEYIGLLKREADIAVVSSCSGNRFGSLFVGGGTPSVLSTPEIAAIFGFLSVFEFVSDSEKTVEVNPESASKEKLGIFLDSGINRLSIGAQSFRGETLRYLGRVHSEKDIYSAFDIARSSGFDNISLDLIYGVPGQSVTEWEADVRKAISLRPEHISIYCLSLEPDVPLYKRVPPDWPDGDLQADMYYGARRLLLNGGYEHYEVSNFSLPGRRCRHNVLYWLDRDYLGLGLSAAFHWNGKRYNNPLTFLGYAASVNSGRWPLSEPEVSDRGREIRTTLVLGLRLIEGVDRAAFNARFGVDVLSYYDKNLDPLIEGGYLLVDDDMLRLSEKSYFISDEIFYRLI